MANCNSKLTRQAAKSTPAFFFPEVTSYDVAQGNGTGYVLWCIHSQDLILFRNTSYLSFSEVNMEIFTYSIWLKSFLMILWNHCVVIILQQIKLLQLHITHQSRSKQNSHERFEVKSETVPRFHWAPSVAMVTVCYSWSVCYYGDSLMEILLYPIIILQCPRMLECNL